jgi:hypothetical protein
MLLTKSQFIVGVAARWGALMFLGFCGFEYLSGRLSYESAALALPVALAGGLLVGWVGWLRAPSDHAGAAPH